MAILRKYGVETKILFPLIDYGLLDFEATPVVDAGADCEIIKNEGTSTTATNDFVHEGRGIYSLTLTAGEMGAARIVVTVIDEVTKTWEDQAILIETYGNVAAQHSIDNATFAADVGSTAYATNIIALAVRKTMNELNLDHLMKTAVSNRSDMPEVVNDTVLANLMTKTDGDTSDYNHTLHSLEALAGLISANATPQDVIDNMRGTDGVSLVVPDAAGVAATEAEVIAAVSTLARTGADNDTLETLSDQIDGIPTASGQPSLND